MLYTRCAVLAVLYDIHGNLPALEAVLTDAHERGAGRFLLGGDYAAFGAWPAQTVARLGELQDATWIRGNWDRWQANPADLPANEVVRAAADFVLAELDAAVVARLGALPGRVTVDGALFCHASPGSDMQGFATQDDPADAELLRGVEERRVVFGHTHLQFRRTSANGIDLVNPGSVGLPFDGDTRAAYALVHPGGDVELRRVAYDHAHAASALRARDEAWAEAVADRIERAAF
jgi:diadenosine tetraphosphatase ApaH/serine/threonine PP2A family protein phosphatase